MLKKIIVIVMCMIMSVLVTTNSFAATYYAYSIGTNYSSFLNPDIDTSGDAKYAATAFSLAGYKSYYNVKPTVSYMRGKNPAGKRRLASKIVFLSGHGNSQLMTFNYKNKGGDYAVGISQGKDWKSESTEYSYTGVESCDMSKTKLYVLAGCQTAAGRDNITRDIVLNGVTVAIGWTESVGATSHTQWLKKFCDKLATGSSVVKARTYANSFTYSDDSVKSSYMYGKGSTVIGITGAKKSFLFN